MVGSVTPCSCDVSDLPTLAWLRLSSKRHVQPAPHLGPWHFVHGLVEKAHQALNLGGGDGIIVWFRLRGRSRRYISDACRAGLACLLIYDVCSKLSSRCLRTCVGEGVIQKGEGRPPPCLVRASQWPWNPCPSARERENHRGGPNGSMMLVVQEETKSTREAQVTMLFLPALWEWHS
eukprot:scaffold21788_cov31-Tisochrysis_lutea.AAC.3